jgi:hypothetical protein
MSKRILLSLSMLLGLALSLEIAAYVLWPAYSDDSAFLKTMVRHVLNSDVKFEDHPNAHPQFGFQYTPHSEKTFSTPEYNYSVKTNAQGLRTKEFRPKEDQEIRILLLGDSNYYGVGVNEDQTIAAVLEKNLSGRFSRPVSVYTLAIPGYNTVQEMQLLRAYGAILQPDAIVMGLFIGNDLLPNLLAQVNAAGNYVTVEAEEEWLNSNVNERMAWFSHSVFLRRWVKPAIAPRMRYALAQSPRVLQRTQDLMMEAKAVAAELQATLTVSILYPADGIAGGWQGWWTKSRDVGLRLMSICEETEVECLDQLDYMSGTDARKRFFFEMDKHPTAQGNVAMANMIEEGCFKKLPMKDETRPKAIQE